MKPAPFVNKAGMMKLTRECLASISVRCLSLICPGMTICFSYREQDHSWKLMIMFLGHLKANQAFCWLRTVPVNSAALISSLTAPVLPSKSYYMVTQLIGSFCDWFELNMNWYQLHSSNDQWRISLIVSFD